MTGKAWKTRPVLGWADPEAPSSPRALSTLWLAQPGVTHQPWELWGWGHPPALGTSRICGVGVTSLWEQQKLWGLGHPPLGVVGVVGLGSPINLWEQQELWVWDHPFQGAVGVVGLGSPIKPWEQWEFVGLGSPTCGTSGSCGVGVANPWEQWELWDWSHQPLGEVRVMGLG